MNTEQVVHMFEELIHDLREEVEHTATNEYTEGFNDGLLHSIYAIQLRIDKARLHLN